jgi:putative endopeptidase
MSKKLLQVCYVLLIGIFSVAQTVFVTAQTGPATADAGKKYELIAGLDKSLIDTSADPCTNFYQYACGNFSKLHPIPSDQSSYDAFAILYEYTQHELYGLLEKTSTNDPSRTPNEQKIGDFYATCMDLSATGKTLAALQPEFDRIANLRSKDELPPLLAHYQLIGINAFFSFGEQQDFKEATKQIAVLDQAGLGLPERDYYLRTGEDAEKTRRQYVQHITHMLKLLGEPDALAASDAQAIMQLETNLARISMDVTSRRDPKNVYHLMPVAQLTSLTPEISWHHFFDHSGAPAITQLNVANPDFLKGLNSLIAATDLDTIKTYLRWQIINSIPDIALPEKMDAESFDFYGRKLRGQPEQEARWKRCASATDNALGEAVGQVYVAKDFPPTSKAAALQMVEDIEGAMDKDIDTLDWMSADTKVKAKEKLHMVADKIGYPDHWRDYSSLTITRGDALGNALRATEFESRRQLAKIGKPVDRGEWGMTAATINAYYNPSMNDINFPAGILQSPFYDAHGTDAEIYGHIGAIVGHELTHGFDDQGRQFDGHGNLEDWWIAEDGKKFDTKADCEVKEYGGFTAVDDVKVNGKLTLGENTADNGGLRLAYMALLQDAKRKNIDLNQKQDGYTPIQQFFLAYGQNWCDNTRPETVRLQVQTDPHSPDEFRANGVVRNMPEFGQAFGCKAGQPMMPANICRVW